MDAGYGLMEVQPVDLFPHTFHIETVTLWKAGSGHSHKAIEAASAIWAK
jgi:hypothetical protein